MTTPAFTQDILQNIVNVQWIDQIFLVGGNNPSDSSPHFLKIGEDGVVNNPPFAGGALTGLVAPIDNSGNGYAVTSGDDVQVTNRYADSTLLFSTASDPVCFDEVGNLFTGDGTVLDLSGVVIRSGSWTENSFIPGLCDGDGSYYTIQQASPGSTPFFLRKYAFKSGVSSWTTNFDSDLAPFSRTIEIGPDGDVWVGLIANPGSSNDIVINKYSSVNGSLLKTLSFPHFDSHEYKADVVAGTNANPVVGNLRVSATHSAKAVDAWTIDRKGRVIVALSPVLSGILSPWITGGGDSDLRSFDSTLNSPVLLKAFTEDGGVVWETNIHPPSFTTNYYSTNIISVRATENRIAITRRAGLSASSYLDGTSLVGSTNVFDNYSYVTGFDNNGVEVWSHTGNQNGSSGFETSTPYTGDIPFPVDSFPMLLSSTPIF